jgi:4-hydroxy-tetrahydrodipicolinate synthase
VIGGILTAMVTPFGPDGELDEDGAVRLIHHLLDNGSDGLVITGSTGEAATLTDDEKARLWEIAVAESGDAPVIAGTGTYDTRHSVELTERAAEAGVDFALVVTPYYVRPTREGIKRHYQAVAEVGLPIVAYNIPSRTATDMPNDLLAELAEIDRVVAVKQARYEDIAPIEGLDLLAGNDDVFAETLDAGATGIISVAAHLVGRDLRREIDEPDRRHEIEEGLRDLFEALTVTTNPIPVKAALNLIGVNVGGLRLPLVDASQEETAVLRAALERHELLAAV